MQPNEQNPNTNPQDGSIPVRPVIQRPILNDFAPRPNAVTRPPYPNPTASSVPPQTVSPQPNQAPTPTTAVSYVATPLPQPPVEMAQSDDLLPPGLPEDDITLENDTKPVKEPSETGHAGLVGLAVFGVLTALFLLPLLPGKTLDNFPGSSQSFSSGDQALACLQPPASSNSSTSFDSKAGFPITYTYASTSKQTATCDSKSQSVVSGHSSQFNPLGLVINIATALTVAAVVGLVWKKIFGVKDKY